MEPILTYSDITGRVYIVTKYKRLDSGVIDTREKFDVTEWVDSYAKKRNAQTVEENAKLVDVLHEVETEAVYAYRCLQQDCVTTANSSEHFFKKWWHAECELDRAEAENTKLRDVVAQMYRDMQGVLDMSTDTVFVDSIGTLRDVMDLHMQAMAELGMPPADYEQRKRELGIEG